VFKIYCAGPLFNPKEREEMQEIATALEAYDYITFLPQRDGLELTKISKYLINHGVSENIVNDIITKAIFYLDIYNILTSDGLVLNMNGRVPDEGAMVEAGVAWSAGIEVVLYKNDTRTVFDSLDNPMILGLSDFSTINKISDIPLLFSKRITKKITDKNYRDNYKIALDIGEKISNMLNSANENDALHLLSIFEENINHESERIRKSVIHTS